MKGLKLRHLLPFLLECSVSNLLLGRQIFLFVDSGCSDLEELYDFCMNFELDRTNFFLVQKVRVQASTRRTSTDFQYTVNISYADIFRDLFLLSIVFYIHLYTVVHRIPKFSPFSLEPTMLDIFTVQISFFTF